LIRPLTFGARTGHAALQFLAIALVIAAVFALPGKPMHPNSGIQTKPTKQV